MNKKEETPMDRKKNEAPPTILRYEVYKHTRDDEEIDLGILPQDMSDPASWKRIIQICKDKEVSILCFLDKPYKSCPYVVFKRNGEYGEYVFFAEYMLNQAIKFAEDEYVDKSIVLACNVLFDVYYVRMYSDSEKSFILYNRSKLRFHEAVEFDMNLNCKDAFFHEDIASLAYPEADHYVDAYEEATEMIDEILDGYFEI